ncbi:MAG: apolipoprotein N-acyltransferase [Ahrensia sp.]|nr:apolipoprotein N-acyltransferase [Ahrensia sp.]
MTASPLTRLAETIILLDGWRAAILALLIGALTALGLAPYHLWPIIFVTLPVLVWLLDGAVPPAGSDGIFSVFRRYWPAFRVGWLFGMGYFLAGMWWVGKAFLVDADEFVWLLPVAVLALPAGLALFYGFAAMLARLAWREGWARLVGLACAFAIAEWLRATVLTGLPWNTLGMIAMPSPVFMQSAGLMGLYGVTFFTVFVAASPAIFAPTAGAGHSRSRRMRRVLVAALMLLLAHIGYGFAVLSNAGTETRDDMVVRIVQPNLLQSEKWVKENEVEIMQRYFVLSNADRGPAYSSAASFTHIVWPESAFPFILTQRRDVLADIAELLPASTVLLTGAMRLENAPDRPDGRRVFNALYAIDGDGEIAAAYDKTRLVPFGEFLPFQSFLEDLGLQQLTQLRGGFARGSRRSTIAFAATPAFLPLICYEIIYSGAVLGEGVEPQWIVNVTNDAWFGNTAGPYQHAHQARIRAVEEGLPLVRAANSGISMIVDAHGRVQAELALGERGVVDGALPAAAAPTLFSRVGTLPVIGFVCLLLMLLIVLHRRDIRRL